MTKVVIINPAGQSNYIEVRIQQVLHDGSVRFDEHRLSPGDKMEGDLLPGLIVAMRDGQPNILAVDGNPIPEETRLVTPDGVVPV